MKIYSLFLFLFLAALHAKDLSESQSAQEAFYFGSYGKAEDLYKRLLLHPIPEWQRGIIYYNLGTIKLAEKNWEASLSQYKAILISEIGSLYLYRYLQTNEGFAHLGLVQALWENPTVADEEQQIYEIQEALANFSTAASIECLLEQGEQEKRCERPADIESLEKVANWMIERARQVQRDDILKNANFAKGLLLIIESLKNLIKIFDVAENKIYLPYLSYQGRKIDLLWDPVEKKTENPQFSKSLKDAREQFREILNNLNNYHLKESKANLEELKKRLEELYRFSIPNASTQLLTKLIFSLQLMLTSDNLSLATFDELLALLDTSKDLIKDDENVNLWLNQAKTNIADNNKILALIYLWGSYYSIEDMLNRQQTSKEAGPVFILGQALTNAKRALRLMRLSSKVEMNPQIESIVKKSIDKALDEAQLFEPNVFQSQLTNYKINKMCQDSPWNEVIPLFEKGYQEALLAKTKFGDPVNISPVLDKQNNTVNSWTKALLMLLQPPSPTSEENQKQQGDNQNALPRLEEMELQDLKIAPIPAKDDNQW